MLILTLFFGTGFSTRGKVEQELKVRIVWNVPMTECYIHECLTTAPAVHSIQQLRERAIHIQARVACFAPYLALPHRHRSISIFWRLLRRSKDWRIPLLLSGQVTGADQRHPAKKDVWGALLLWPMEKRDSAREILGA